MATIGGRAHSAAHIKHIGELGYPYAEISLTDFEEAQTMRSDLVRLRDEYGLFYLAHYPNENDPFDAQVLKTGFVPRIKRLIEASDALDIRKATLHFWMDTRWAPPELLEAKKEMLAEMVQYAAGFGVTLCLENLTEQSQSFLPLFADIPELKMTLDIGHAQLLCETNTSFGFIEDCFEHIAHMHVHDNLGGETVKDDLHLPLGEGVVDYPAIFTGLKQKGYAHSITMEVTVAHMQATKEKILQFI